MDFLALLNRKHCQYNKVLNLLIKTFAVFKILFYFYLKSRFYRGIEKNKERSSKYPKACISGAEVTFSRAAAYSVSPTYPWVPETQATLGWLARPLAGSWARTRASSNQTGTNVTSTQQTEAWLAKPWCLPLRTPLF